MSEEQTKPSGYYEVVTPSDTVDFTKYNGAYPRALYIGGAGNVTVVRPDGTAVLFTALPVGTVFPIKCRRVNSTATTATPICALW